MSCSRSLVLARGLGALPFASRENIGASTQWPLTLIRKQLPRHQDCSVWLSRSFYTSPQAASSEPAPSAESKDQERGPRDKSLVTYDDLFKKAAGDSRTKATFNRVVDTFCNKNVRRRGHVEFIYAALKKMPEFGVERDINIYNRILDVFPKEVFVPQNFIQRMFNHYPRQQECGVQVLEQMENYGIMPNKETKFLLVQIFGEKSHPVRKYQRIMYWFPKFKHANPYPVPAVLPQDPLDLAKFSLQRIAADLDAKTTVFQMPATDISEDGAEVKQPYVVGIQGPDQQDLLAKHNPDRPVFVEGPFPLWLRQTCVYYYILRADPLPPEERVEEEMDSERNFYYPMVLDFDLDRDLGDYYDFDVDDVEEGPIFSLCMTDSGDQITLGKWISGLQQTNPVLGCTPVVFRLDSGPQEIQTPTEAEATDDEDIIQNQKMKQ
ncbi:evolutionarily conserved signaling intermediate in Toll pathway, mitochondrial [Latimeria chalumnae]|uniref:Evolutionarily conserved signaling intermediate in Toll pathway, mitochondrial n=1 Tax=Latimeria chalumnae TaxID=7897 RepID=H3BCG7_LATCH|nr:PREDICTED: evolutionarily conserved signaling intermediate in Toll pathway, mitochondrial [Latimeria chalumnae]|eukprot:XP_005994181.1 PREDICTED: evolutionarily conserved signaling intermediate in Toll pathway, mitochondrial [Latimeria chalumnae]